MRIVQLLSGLTLVGALSMTSAAFAQGVTIAPTHLSTSDRAALLANIDKARKANPAIFERVKKARQMAIEVDGNRRGRFASITLPLRSMGKDALFPMLEMLAVDAPKRGAMTETAWTTLRVSLLEAVGEVRDPRARPVLVAVIERDPQAEVIRAAAESLGRLLDDTSAKQLVALAQKPGRKQLPILAGMGECRREIAVRELARQSTSSDPAVVTVVLKALGEAGNSWAWQTPAIKATGEEDAVRGIAATALLNAFVKHTGPLRERAAKSLVIVDWAKTKDLIAVARKNADPRTASALAHLEQRLANNVTRRP